MLLSKRTLYHAGYNEHLVFLCLGQAAYKLWNIGNYEKRNYKKLGMESYPDWYDQKKRLKDEFWYKGLPSQTAQEVLKVLEQSWKSFFCLKESGGIENPAPPRFKQKEMGFWYLKDAIVKKENKIHLSIPKQLKQHLEAAYGINANYLYLKIEAFSDIETIRRLQITHQGKGVYEIIAVYKVEEPEVKEDNGRYLSIDLGIKQLCSCYDNEGKGFLISGNRYLNANYYYNKKIAHYQSISDKQQKAEGKKYPVKTKKVKKLHARKRNVITDILHKATKRIADYCEAHDIHTVVIGDIKHIRKDQNLGRTNQVFHSLPYEQFYQKLEYKLALRGIRLVKQKEHYSSQCSPKSAQVNRDNAKKDNRKKRGLYVDGHDIYHADMVGAYNILRLYEQGRKKEAGQKIIEFPLRGLSNPLKVSV